MVRLQRRHCPTSRKSRSSKHQAPSRKQHDIMRAARKTPLPASAVGMVQGALEPLLQAVPSLFQFGTLRSKVVLCTFTALA